jgi:hypothetical protein
VVIAGNLDCERVWARMAEPDRAYRQRRLPAPVESMLSAIATLLRVYADGPTTLWTPLPVAADRLPALDGIGDVELVSGGALPTEADLTWGAMTDAAVRCNDRRFAARLGLSLLVPTVVDSMQALEESIDRDGAHWVLKAPMSASGRLRLRRRGALDDAARTRAERLFALCGELVFEPWVERICDFGCAGVIADDGEWHAHAPHGQLCDGAGVFRGIDLDRDGLDTTERVVVEAVMSRVATALVDAGYRGPFGIDGYVYEGEAGERLLQPLSEINARYSFGHVARAFADLLGHGASLRLGTGPVPEGALALLCPGTDDSTSAWLD